VCRRVKNNKRGNDVGATTSKVRQRRETTEKQSWTRKVRWWTGAAGRLDSMQNKPERIDRTCDGRTCTLGPASFGFDRVVQGGVFRRRRSCCHRGTSGSGSTGPQRTGTFGAEEAQCQRKGRAERAAAQAPACLS